MTAVSRRLSFRGCVCCQPMAQIPERRRLSRRRVFAAGATSATIVAAAGAASVPSVGAHGDRPAAAAGKMDAPALPAPGKLDSARRERLRNHHVAPATPPINTTATTAIRIFRLRDN